MTVKISADQASTPNHEAGEIGAEAKRRFMAGRYTKAACRRTINDAPPKTQALDQKPGPKAGARSDRQPNR
jgi:hypothetical protein